MAHRHFESKEARQVSFSKRITALFKEVSELSIMCGIDVAAVVFSPTGKAFSFGHPSVEAILERFAQTRAAAGGGGCAYIRKDHKKLAKLKKEYKELRAQLNAEKARKVRVEAAMAKERAVASLGAAWLEADIRDLGEEDLISYAKVLAEVLAIVPRSANHGHAMPPRARSSNNIQMRQPPQQFLANNGVGFLDSFNVGSANNNNGIEMTITPALGFGVDSPY